MMQAGETPIVRKHQAFPPAARRDGASHAGLSQRFANLGRA